MYFLPGAALEKHLVSRSLRLQLLQDDIMDELRRVHANLNTMPRDRVLVELATIKKRASRSDKMADAIIPLMKEIHSVLSDQSGGGAQAASKVAANGERKGRLRVSATRKSRQIMSVVVGGGLVLLGVLVLAVRGGSDDAAARVKKEAKKNN